MIAYLVMPEELCQNVGWKTKGAWITLTRISRFVILAVLLTLFALSSTAAAQFSTKISYNTWDSFPLSFGAEFVTAGNSVVELDMAAGSFRDGDERHDLDRWFLTYGRGEWVRWRVGGLYSRALDLVVDAEGKWHQVSSNTSVKPLVGIQLIHALSDSLSATLGADVYGGIGEDSLGRRAKVEVSVGNASIGYTWDTDDRFSGAHAAYTIRVP